MKSMVTKATISSEAPVSALVKNTNKASAVVRIQLGTACKENKRIKSKPKKDRQVVTYKCSRVATVRTIATLLFSFASHP